MKQRFILFVSTLVLSIVFGNRALAYEVEVDGICYNLDETNKTAEVTFKDLYHASYSGVIVIPSSITVNDSNYDVTAIGIVAFRNCSGLTSVTIPNSVTSIGNFAFEKCSGLTSVTIPNSVTSIGESAFGGCSGLTSVTIPNSVTSIGDSAFRGCSGLTSVTIPNSVTSIGDFAFSWCSGLTSVTIPNSVTSIGNNAFQNCNSLTSITIPNSVTSIGEETFSYCRGLTSVTIPNSVTSIGDRAFSWCSGLTSVTIPNSVTSIGYYAFEGCSGLISVTIPNSVTSIGDGAFHYCEIKKLYYDCSVDPYIYSDYLEELIIGDNVTTIYDYFKKSPIKKIILGMNVSEIRAEAFKNSKISEFTITGEGDIYCYPNIFGTQDLSKSTLYVPESKIDYYKITEPWSGFGTIKALESTSVKTIKYRSILIHTSNGFVTLSGLNTDEQVSFYATDGRELGTVKAIDGTAHFAAQSGTVVIAKIGKESLKIAVK